MIILGIDPGSRVTGYGLIEVIGRKVVYLDSGILKFDGIEPFTKRLPVIYKNTLDLIEKYRPGEIAIESLIYVKSVTSLAKLAQARGAMIAAFQDTEMSEYSPNLIKSTVTGHGHASKDAVDKILQLTLGSIEIKRHDESDALAIALCHALLRGRNTILAQTNKRQKALRR